MIEMLLIETMHRTNISKKLNHEINLLQDLHFRVGKLIVRYSSDHYIKLLNPIADLIQENIDFAYILLNDYFKDKFPRRDHLKSGIKKEGEMKKLENLIRNLDLSNENQTMVFNNLKIEEIYEKRIIIVTNFTLHRTSKLLKDLRSTSTLYYDVVLPFHDKNYDRNSNDSINVWFLPFFFVFSGN